MKLIHNITAVCTLIFLAYGCLAEGVCADSITVRSSVRMPANGTPLILRHVAKLHGDAAAECGDVVIRNEFDSHEPVEISIDHIRSILDEHGINWAKVSLTGSVLTVRPRATSDAILAMNSPMYSTHSLGMGSSVSSMGKSSSFDMQGFVAIDSLSNSKGAVGKIISAINSQWETTKGDLYVRIEEQGLGKIPADAIDHVIRLRGTPQNTDWVDVEIRSLRDSSGIRPTKTSLVRVDLRVRADVPVAIERLSSRHVLSREDMEHASRLIRPSDAERLLHSSELTGRKIAKVLQPGDILLWSALEPEIVISRNDSVRVVMGGAFNLSGTDAYALERGAVGDRIKCRWRAGDEPFTALVVAAGEVRAGG